MWSHISGFNPPYVFSDTLIAYSDRFIFTSPISYNTHEIQTLQPKERSKLGYIWTTGDIEEYSKVTPINHKGFNIGFIGTLDYSKLHPNFIDFCSKIDIPDVKFIVCGDGCDADKIKQQIKDKGIEDKFLFTGMIDDIKPYLSIIDVFGYPLNPTHFGTCEQVLGEAIAAGVIPVVMNNPAEKYILFQSLVRFICTTEQEYIHNIQLLYENKKHQDQLISLIQENITGLYNSRNMVESWNMLFKEQMEVPKKNRGWVMTKKRRKMGGAGIFLDSIGKYGSVFERNDVEGIKALFKSNLQWFSSSKGSPRQYLNTFPNDKHLKNWVNMLEELEQGDCNEK
jgi:glycosyltransferase involved in cell wall biosynthesis